MIATTPRPVHHDKDDVVLVPFAKEHLKGALRLSQEISWPYRLEDWAIALELGHGFVLLDGAGSVIATAAWWAYGEDHASAGMIIVAKAAQGRGHGARLMDALQAAAHPRTFTLNSTAEGLALYEKRGFLRIDAIQQRAGVPGERHPTPPASRVGAMAASEVEAVARLGCRPRAGPGGRCWIGSSRPVTAECSCVKASPAAVPSHACWAAGRSSVPWLPKMRQMHAP